MSIPALPNKRINFFKIIFIKVIHLRIFDINMQWSSKGPLVSIALILMTVSLVIAVIPSGNPELGRKIVDTSFALILLIILLAAFRDRGAAQFKI